MEMDELLSPKKTYWSRLASSIGDLKTHVQV